MIDLKNKNIILFSPFGSCKNYSEEIQNELLRRGANVLLYDERPSQSAITKIYIYLFRRLFPSFFINYIKKVIEECPYKNVDYILVVRGQAFDREVLSLLRRSFEGVKIILYQWDTISGINAPDVIDCYDCAYSYDPNDVSNNKYFQFRPTFYLEKYLSTDLAETFEYSICFVGTLYKERWPIIKKFKECVESIKPQSYFYLYLSNKILYYYYRFTSRVFAPIEVINFSLLYGEDYLNLIRKSKCILDINYTSQKGLSLRSFEAMASKRKYITTNDEIKKYDFYNPNNILVVDAQNPIISQDFIDSPYEPVDNKLLYKYSVRGFIDDIFENI